MPRQQTATEAALQNLCNTLSRRLGVSPAPIIQLKDSQYFAFQSDIEHKFAEYNPDDHILYVSPDLAPSFDDPTQSLINPANVLKLTMLFGGLPTNLVEPVLRHHLIHVGLYQTLGDEAKSLTHSKEFIDEANRLNVAPFELKDATDIVNNKMIATTAKLKAKTDQLKQANNASGAGCLVLIVIIVASFVGVVYGF